MTRTLSLHPLTALDATPDELVRIAGALGVPLVCLFTHVPDAAAHIYRKVARDDVAALTATMRAAGVGVCNLEVFPLDVDRLDPLDEGLAVGASLDATRATAHIHDVASEAQAIDRFAAFAARAAGFGIVAGLEFNRFSAVTDIGSAERIVRGAGAGSLVCDALHLVRGGGDVGDVAGAADLIGYAQLSDGPAEIADDRRWKEAVSERALPGDGAFPLAAMVRALTADTVLEVEVPQSAARKEGVPAEERCRRAVEAARRVLAAAEIGVPA